MTEEPTASNAGTGAADGADTAAVPSTTVTRAARRALFSPATEHVAEAPARLVCGRLPAWLSGRLMLNGCGEYRGMQHLFDGYACLSGVRLDGPAGTATASQRFLDSDAYGHFKRTGRLKHREFGTAPPAPLGGGPVGRAAALVKSLVAAFAGRQGYSDNASVSLTPLPGGQLLALSEALPAAYRVDGTSLATGGQVRYRDGVPGDITTAHPKVLPDGTIVNFSRSLPFGGYHVYVQDPTSLERKQVAFVRDRDPLAPCWVHDMAATANYLVIVEPPLFMNLGALMTGAQRPFVFMDWKPEAGSRVHVVSLSGSGAVVTHTAPPLFTFHFANAFERPAASGYGIEICVDFSVYNDPEIVNDLSLDRLNAFPGKDISPSWLRRLTIPLADADGRPVGPSVLATPTPLIRDECSYGNFVEFPIINPMFRGLPYRYAYTTAAVRPTNMSNALARHDLADGTSRLWHAPGGMPGEPLFVPRPGAVAEDDGMVLAALARGDGRSSVVVLDGASMQLVAEVELPFCVPYRFHGTFVADGEGHPGQGQGHGREQGKET
ncbi:hypothetical protein GPECTOR_5g387 [Gonium pectorale]|uniref:Dioxygenase n=1 Tax=Gonium pectorale TaxID=33097 RepID=A0A150GWS0_GONPE|nr:hypothetical protein GPECTOR_5g387 [Gonium pectorale]|eukprot:KXZ54301.1 hypothetical protein GPECTOR_5g387 [Gonium pectorale]